MSVQVGERVVFAGVSPAALAGRAIEVQPVPAGPEFTLGERKRIRGCVVRIAGMLKDILAVELLEEPSPIAFEPGIVVLDGWCYEILGRRDEKVLLRCLGRKGD